MSRPLYIVTLVVYYVHSFSCVLEVSVLLKSGSTYLVMDPSTLNAGF